MITDTNSIVEAGASIFIQSAGGNMIFLGILLFIGLAMLLVMARARAGTSILVMATLSFTLSLLTPEFMIVFWVILLISIIVLVNALRKRFTGQA